MAKFYILDHGVYTASDWTDSRVTYDVTGSKPYAVLPPDADDINEADEEE